MKFYICEHCGNIVGMVNDKCSGLACCGHGMKELVPGTSDGAAEKHVPVPTVEGNKVTVMVGEVAHPMLEEHNIGWIAIETTTGAQRKALAPGQEPKTEFLLSEGQELVATYAYCNLHGLWKA